MVRRYRRLAVYLAVTGLLATGAVSANVETAHANILTAGCDGGPGDPWNCAIYVEIDAPVSMKVSVAAMTFSTREPVSGLGAGMSWTVTCTDSTGTAETAGGLTGVTPMAQELAPLPATADGECEVIVHASIDTTDPDYSIDLELQNTLVTTTTITSSANPSAVGQQVTYTATVSPVPNMGGTVSFTDNGSPLAGCGGLPFIRFTGTAVCAATLGTPGVHQIVAAYSGATGFFASTSPVLTEVVTPAQCSSLAGCNLHGLNLTGAQLSGADLSNANLNGANLTGADLSGANLSGANLNKANLTGANLSGADVTGANFNKVTWSNTTCPDGTNSDADGGTCTGNL